MMIMTTNIQKKIKQIIRKEKKNKHTHTHITKLDIMRGKMQYSECLNDCGKLEKIFMAQP